MPVPCNINLPANQFSAHCSPAKVRPACAAAMQPFTKLLETLVCMTRFKHVQRVSQNMAQSQTPLVRFALLCSTGG